MALSAWLTGWNPLLVGLLIAIGLSVTFMLIRLPTRRPEAVHA
jgi:hypothetical protein